MYARVQIWAGPPPVTRHKQSEFLARNPVDFHNQLDAELRRLFDLNPDQIAIMIDRPRQ